MKKTLGFRLNLNGKHVSNAGLDEENYVIVGTTTFVQGIDGSKSYALHFGGMDSDKREHLTWYNSDLKLGDIMTMEVVDGPFDIPLNRCKSEIGPEAQLKDKLNDYYRLKEELKDHLK